MARIAISKTLKFKSLITVISFRDDLLGRHENCDALKNCNLFTTYKKNGIKNEKLNSREVLLEAKYATNL